MSFYQSRKPAQMSVGSIYLFSHQDMHHRSDSGLAGILLLLSVQQKKYSTLATPSIHYVLTFFSTNAEKIIEFPCCTDGVMCFDAIIDI